MATTHRLEIFSAGCPVCDETISLVNRLAGPGTEVTVLDMKDPSVVERAAGLGVRSVPAVAIDGKLAECCAGHGPDEATLRAAGLGE